MTTIFDQFTRKYQLSKTLRFELKPVGKTEDLLKANKVFEKDKTIDDSYNQAKFYFYTLHQKFINSALASDQVNSLKFDELANFLKVKHEKAYSLRQELSTLKKEKGDTKAVQKKINDTEKEIEEKKEEFYKNIRALLDTEADKWKKEYIGKKLEGGGTIKFGKKNKSENQKEDEKKNEKGVGFLTSAGILQILKYEFPGLKEEEFRAKGWPSLFVKENENPGEKRYIFDSFDKFSGYLTKFQETRKNIYADNGIASALATRIISNFEIFLANKRAYENKHIRNIQKIGIDCIDIFDIDNYKKYLLQSGIEALGGSEDSQNSYNKVIGLLNKKIKEYRDQKASEAKQQKSIYFKKSEYPLFKTLEKQILGKVEKEKQLIETTEAQTEEEVFVRRFKEFIDMNEAQFEFAKKFLDKLFNGNEFVSEYEGVFIKNLSINTISRRWFTDGYDFERNLPQASKDKKEGDVVKVKKFVTLADIKGAVEKLEGNPYKEKYYKKEVIKKNGQDLWSQFLSIWKFEFENLFKDIESDNGNIIKGYNAYLLEAKELDSFSKERKAEEIAVIKNYADAALRIFQMMKYLALDECDMSKLTGISTDFYAEMDGYLKDRDGDEFTRKFNKYYNAFRNYITKKPFDEDKIKLNFEKGTLLKGFSKQYHSYLFKKVDNDHEGFYLGILKSREIDEMVDMQNKSDYLYFPASQLKFQNLVNKAFEGRFGYVYSEQTDEQKAIKDAQKFIEERHLKRHPELKALVVGNFTSKKEFTKEVNRVCINIYSKNSFLPLDRSQVEEKHEEGNLYLFRIQSKDWSKNKKSDSQKNTHTLYFEQLFSSENLMDPIFKISGGSEIFLRDLTEKIEEERNHIVTQEKNKDITEFLNKKFDVEKYQHNRYAERKYFLHLSTVLNYSERKPPIGDKLSLFVADYNKEIRKRLAEYAKFKKVNVIGLDRGEKHLVYYSVVNPKGEILDQGSLNEIETKVSGKEVKVNYRDKLVAREKERIENRQSWNPVGKIKDLKKGYVSQVVRKIADLVIEYNAIVVMEDLNMRFKQIRGGVERSVYQQLEKQLIDKFGYLVFKDRKPEEPGGALNGYQLSAPFKSFENMDKQTGVIFYAQADYTSVTDPLTGFRKNVYISNSASQKTIAEAMDKFKAIGWDDEAKSYFFAYNPVEFAEEKFKENTFSKEWKVYAKVPRIRREKDRNGYWQYKPIDPNQKFIELFKLWEFDNIEGDIWEQIQARENDGLLKGEKEFDGKARSFYHSFVYLFNLVLQLRNSYSEQWVAKEKDGKIVVERIGEDVDFIASPIKPFFSTRSVNKKGEILSPQNFDIFEGKIISDEKNRIIKEFNGDANGAYNIARKGVIILNRIAENQEKPDLFISKYDWDATIAK